MTIRELPVKLVPLPQRLKALARAQETASHEDVEIELCKGFARSLDNGLPFPKDYEAWHTNFFKLAIAIETCVHDKLNWGSTQGLFVGSNGELITEGKSGNDVELPVAEFRKSLVALNKLGIPFKKSGDIAKKRIAPGVYAFSSVDLSNPDTPSLSFSITQDILPWRW